jgi:precorrin-2/cobalt-factor-2 C20-methyltransferase
MSGRLVGVGVGPGDPELLTVKGLRVLREADEVFVPVADTGEVGRAEATVREYVDEGRIKRLLFALSDDTEARARNWTNAAQGVSEHLRSGKTCAFATIGDPNVYSTFTYLARAVREVEPDVQVETVPGITALQDLASRSGTVLLEGDPSGRRSPVSRRWSATRAVAGSGRYSGSPRREVGWRMPYTGRGLVSRVKKSRRPWRWWDEKGRISPP